MTALRKTVGVARKKATARDIAVEPAKRIGLDGKKRKQPCASAEGNCNTCYS